MGPSVKFVSHINGSFSKKIMDFFLIKKDKTGAGGSGAEEGFTKDQTFPFFFFFGTLP